MTTIFGGNMNLEQLKLELNSFTIFDRILEEDVFIALNNVVREKEEEAFISYYCQLCSAIYKEGANLSRYIYNYVMNDENVYVLDQAKQKDVLPVVIDSVQRELKILQKIANLTSEEILQNQSFSIELPVWENTKVDLEKDYFERIQDLPKKGYGIFAKYYVFGVDENGLYPIKHPDKQALSEMTGYEHERSLLIKNTLALIEGMKANNALLYGDAGTGKSSSIKAIVNEYHDQGLRLIEVKKKQISYLPDVIESISNNPLKFIVFIDDLSFSSNDDEYVALKNILEGGTSSNKNNVVIYATSNRRHFMKESFSDRNGDELHRNDTIQESMSLAARFGLTITFQKPGKNLFMDIVRQYAKDYELIMDDKELAIKAEAFAIRNNGRSPRTAKQFVEYEKINQTITEE